MKKVLFGLMFTLSLASVFAFIAPLKKAKSDVYKVSTETSKIEWVGSKKSGYHTGTLSLKSGSITVEAGKLTGGKFVIDMSSIKSTDGAGEKLEGHLKSKDFFDVAGAGESVYEITSVNYTSENVAEINGNLNLKGATVAVKFTANIRNLDEKGFFGQANFSIDRTLWGVNYGKGMVSNDIQVGVYLFAKK